MCCKYAEILVNSSAGSVLRNTMNYGENSTKPRARAFQKLKKRLSRTGWQCQIQFVIVIEGDRSSSGDPTFDITFTRFHTLK